MLTKTGLVYLETTAGEGDEPTAADKVKVHYEGRLIDGTVFDSSIADRVMSRRSWHTDQTADDRIAPYLA